MLTIRLANQRLLRGLFLVSRQLVAARFVCRATACSPIYIANRPGWAPRLLRAIESGCSLTQRRAAGALGNLLVASADNAPAVIAAGGIPRLMALLKRGDGGTPPESVGRGGVGVAAAGAAGGGRSAGHCSGRRHCGPGGPGGGVRGGREGTIEGLHAVAAEAAGHEPASGARDPELTPGAVVDGVRAHLQAGSCWTDQRVI